MRLEQVPNRAVQNKSAIQDSTASNSDADFYYKNPFEKKVTDSILYGEYDAEDEQPEDELEKRELLSRADRIVLKNGFSSLFDKLSKIDTKDFPDIIAFPDTASRPLSPGIKIMTDILAAEKDVPRPDYQYIMLFHETEISDYGEARNNGKIQEWENTAIQKMFTPILLNEQKYREGRPSTKEMVDQHRIAWEACYERMCDVVKQATKRTEKNEVTLLITDEYYSEGRTLKLLKTILEAMDKDPNLPKVKPMFFAFYANLTSPDGEKISGSEQDAHISQQIKGIAWHGSDATTDSKIKSFGSFAYAHTFAFSPDGQEELKIYKSHKIGVKKELGSKFSKRTNTFDPERLQSLKQIDPDYSPTKNMRLLRQGITSIAYDVLDEKFGIDNTKINREQTYDLAS